MTMSPRKKRTLITGAAILAVAGITTGGALVTNQSTIFDNQFSTTATPPADPVEMVVTGPAMSKSYSGAVDGEVASEYYTIENKHATKELKFNVSTKLHPNGTKAAELAAALDTRINAGAGDIDTGKLDSMDIPAGDQITVPAGTNKTIRIDVLVKDASAFTVDPNSEVTVDYLFDSIFS